MVAASNSSADGPLPEPCSWSSSFSNSSSVIRSSPSALAETEATGAAGGGGGGAIFLQAELNIEVNGNLSATGGLASTGGGLYGGNGGAGGAGVIRIDDLDGVVTGGGSISPTPTLVALGASGFETLSSGIDPGCAMREDMTPNNQGLLGAILLMLVLIGLNFKELKKVNARW